MFEALLPAFQWMQETAMTKYIQGTTWTSPIIQVIHLVAVALFIGSVLVVDIRLLGHGLTETPLATLARATQPYLLWAFAVLFVTGVPQMVSLAMKQYYSPFFWWKMEAMAFAIVLTFWTRRKIANTDEAAMGTFWPKAVGLTSLGLWTGVIIGARLIGLFS